MGSTTPAFQPSAATETLPLDNLDQLIGLAASRPAHERQRLLFGVADLYRSVGGQTRAPDPLTEVFVNLVRAAERDIRRAMAERLADATWAPVDLVRMLAADAIEIARPIIAASPLLADADLLALLNEASLDHQVQVALRPGLHVEVARAILDRADPTVMTALASNRTAQLDAASLDRLVDNACSVAALRAPLTRHAGLSEALAMRLYQWVGDALKQAISDRFNLDAERLAEAVDASVFDASAWGASGTDQAAARLAAARLAAKLLAADQLRPATLIRALRDRNLELFIHALTLLGQLEIDQVRQALRGDTARPLFLACTAAGLDRAAFPVVLQEIRQLNHGYPHDPDSETWRPAQRSAAQAAYEFRLLMSPENAPSV